MIEYILGATLVSGLTYLITKKTNKNTFTLTSDTSTKSIFPKPPKPRFIREDASDKKQPKEKHTSIPYISNLDLNNINHIRLDGSSDIIIRNDRIITDNCAILELKENILYIKTINHTRMNGRVYLGGNFIGSDNKSNEDIREISLEEKIIKLDNFKSAMNISHISLKGSGKLIFDGLTFNHELATVLQGSGDIIFRNCTIFEAGMEVNGSGDIIMDNDSNANILSLSVKGSGDITIHASCKVNIVKKNIKGSGDITILTNYKKM